MNQIQLLGVEDIGAGAFERCYGLRGTENSRKVLSIEDRAFYSCKYLERIIAPQCSSLGAEAFGDCTEIVKVNFDNDMPLVTEINDKAFTGCLNLNEVFINNVTRITGTEVFANTPINIVEARKLTQLGATTGNNNIFANNRANPKSLAVIVPKGLETVDGGHPDGDLVYVLTDPTLRGTVIYLDSKNTQIGFALGFAPPPDVNSFLTAWGNTGLTAGDINSYTVDSVAEKWV